VSTYREIIGKKIKKVSSDPSSGTDGEMWYNSTTGTLRGPAIVEAWSSGAPMPTSNGIKYAAGAGTQTAGLFFGGNDNPPGARRDETFEYNGSGWTVGGSLTTPWYLGGGMGTQTAGLQAFGKTTGMVSEAFEYNGTSWTAAGDGNTGRQAVGSAGSQTAGLCFGGVSTPPTTWRALTESYNGTAWSEVADLSTARNQVGFLGDVSTSALCIGGETPPSWTTIANVEEWGGSSWTAGTAFPAVTQLGVGTGSVTDGLYYGTAPNNAEAFNYDGTTWTAIANLGTGRDAGVRCGTGTTAALLASGSAPTSVVLTEEYNKSTTAYTAAAWASGGAMGTARTGLASAGTKDANVFIGGQMSNSPNAPLNTVELYNGTTWSSNPNNAPYSASNNCGTGTQTAALSWGGYPNITTTLEFDGSSFTTTGALGTGRELTSNNIGVQTAAIAASGFQRPGTYPTQTEEYNGSSWTGGPVVNTPRYSAAGAGTTAAALISGGIEPGQLSNAEEYNGSSWTSVTSRPYAGGNAGTSGTQTASLAYGGNPGGALTTTVSYDGTSWATSPSMAQARAMMGSSAGGTSTAALASSGAAPTATEEFTGETSAANIEDFTTS